MEAPFLIDNDYPSIFDLPKLSKLIPPLKSGSKLDFTNFQKYRIYLFLYSFNLITQILFGFHLVLMHTEISRCLRDGVFYEFSRGAFQEIRSGNFAMSCMS